MSGIQQKVQNNMSKINEKTFVSRYNRYSQKNIKSGGDLFEDRLIYRGFAAKIAYHLSQKGVKANTITLLSFLLLILGIILFVNPNPLYILVFILLNEASLFLDCVDGPLARYYKNNLIWGKIMDNFFHALVSALFIIGFSLHIYNQGGNVAYLILGQIGALTYILDVKWLETLATKAKAKGTSDSVVIDKIKNLLRLFDDITSRLIIIFIFEIISINQSFALLPELFLILNVTYNVFTKLIYRTAKLFIYSR